MATTTYGTTEAKNTNAVYWGIAVVLFLAIIAFAALRPRETVSTALPPAPVDSAPATTTNVNGAARVTTETESTTTTSSTPADDSSINTNKDVETEKATDSQAQ